MSAKSNRWQLALVVGCLIAGLSGYVQKDLLREGPWFTDESAARLHSRLLKGNSMDGQAIDIDDDGDTDMVLAMEFQRNVLLINDGDGHLRDETASRFPSDAHDSEDIAVADFDGDGDLDLVFVSEDDQTNEYYEQIDGGKFISRPLALPTTGTSNAVVASDLNGDNLQDLIIGNAGQNVVLINLRGKFTEDSRRLPANRYTTQDLDIGDIDNDGDLDLLEGNETFNRLLLNDGKGFFSLASPRLPKINDQTRDADLGDVDGDGDLDIFFSNVDFGGIGDPQNRLLLNDGLGFFQEVTKSHLPESSFRTVDTDFVDLDADGDLDLLCGNRWNGSEMMVLINDGTAHFEDQTRKFFPTLDCYPFDFQIADFNKDGHKDIYICAFRGNDILLVGRPQ